MSEMKPWHDCPLCPKCNAHTGSPVGWSGHDAHIESFEEGHNLFCPACGHSWRSTWREDRQALASVMAYATEQERCRWAAIKPRDPRVEPREGDWLLRDGFEVRIDHVANGCVYFVRFQESVGQPAQIPIEDFRRLAVDARTLSMVEQ